MKVWSVIFNIIAVVLILLMLTVFNQMLTTNERQFEQIRLSYAVDYAVDAALSAGVHAGSNRVDAAAGLDAIQVNMNNLLPTFDNLMALSYDMSLDDDSFISIEQSIATGILCTTNGYYVLEQYEVDRTPYDINIGGEYELLWGLKRPYLCYTDDGRLFSLNLINEQNTEFLSEEIEEYGVQTRLQHNDSFVGTPLTNDIKKQAISKLLTDDINIAINNRNKENINKNMNFFYMPSSDSLSAINDIESPTLLLVLQDSTLINGMDIDSVSIAGARVRAQRVVIGFTLTGDDTLYYCYGGQQIVGADRIEGQTVTVLESFPSIQKAAEAGYHPHFSLLSVVVN